jgi:hypothetical protein
MDLSESIKQMWEKKQIDSDWSFPLKKKIGKSFFVGKNCEVCKSKSYSNIKYIQYKVLLFHQFAELKIHHSIASINFPDRELLTIFFFFWQLTFHDFVFH